MLRGRLRKDGSNVQLAGTLLTGVLGEPRGWAGGVGNREQGTQTPLKKRKENWKGLEPAVSWFCSSFVYLTEDVRDCCKPVG